LQLFKDDFSIELRATLPIDELLKVAASLQFQDTNNIPIIITELELNSQRYNETDMRAFACEGLRNVSKQWIEIHNASDRVIDLQGIGIELYQGQTMQNSLFKQPLQPREYRFIELSSQLIFPTNKSFAVVRFGGDPLRIDSTPVLNDSMPTYKTWQKIDEQWVFLDPTPCSAPAKSINQISEDDSKYSPSGLMTVKTDKEVYSRTECIQVSGTVPAILEGIPVIIEVFGPNNAKYLETFTPPKYHPLGTYLFDFKIGEDGITGTYTVRATYGNNVVWTEFSLVSGVLIGDEALQVRSLTNGCFLSAEVDPDGKSLRLSVRTNAIEDGELQIMLPRNLIDAKTNGNDDDFTVLVDREKANFDQTDTTSVARTLVIPIHAGAKEIEIKGTHVIPEFPIVWIILIASFFVVSLYARYFRRFGYVRI